MMTATTLQQRNMRIGLLALLLAVGMVGIGYAAVPLYRLFCQVTGFGGTTQRASDEQAFIASELGKSAGSPTISVRFDASLGTNMPWSFRPRQVTNTVAIGQRNLAIFEARNDSDEPITGTATFNVQPTQAGVYFSKIQCFCFTEQTLRPGQSVDMPVLFFVDPAALDDPRMKNVEQITLSYTFHRALEPS